MQTLKFKSRPAIAFFTGVNQISGSFQLLPSSDHMRLDPLVNMVEAMVDFTAADQGFQDSQELYEYVSIELPDSEETQIVDSEDDQVRLYFELQLKLNSLPCNAQVSWTGACTCPG